MRRLSCESGLWTPGVSTSTICAAGTPFFARRFMMPRMRLRVVCGLCVTMAIFSPTSAFSSVDLPALGRPMMETKPERNLAMRLSPDLLRFHRIRRGSDAHAHALDEPVSRLQHFIAQAVVAVMN